MKMGCLWIVMAFISLMILLSQCEDDGGSSDCYATPGAQEGSAQHDRDIQRCLGQ